MGRRGPGVEKQRRRLLGPLAAAGSQANHGPWRSMWWVACIYGIYITEEASERVTENVAEVKAP